MTTNINTVPETVGMTFQSELPFEEWREIGQRFGEASKRFSWALGDWLVHGSKSYKGRVSDELYREAEQTTGIDRATLVSLATVSRRIPIDKRLERLSYEHHQAIAGIANEDKREHWLKFLESAEERPSKKLLKLSISCFPDSPKIITADEYAERKRKFGADNYIPHLTKLLSVLRKTLPAMSEYEKAAARADLCDLKKLIERI